MAHTFRTLCTIVFVSVTALIASASADRIIAPGLKCFPVPMRSSWSCRVDVIPGLTYIFWYSPPTSQSNLTDDQIHEQLRTELRQYQSIEDAYRDLLFVKDALEHRSALTHREYDAISDFEDKYRHFVTPLQSDSRAISTQELHTRLQNGLKVYVENVARLRRIRLLMNLMVQRRILGAEQSRDIVVFAERYDLIHEATESVVDEIKMSAAVLLDENKNLKDSLQATQVSVGAPSSGSRPVLHKGVQLGSLFARPSEESQTISIPGNKALFMAFKPLTTYIVDDQSVYAIRLDVDISARRDGTAGCCVNYHLR